MNYYLILIVAVAFEVFGTMLLPVSQNFTRPLPSFVLLVSYCISVYLLAICSQKLPLAIIYASWAGLGVFTVALLSYIFFQQTLTWQAILGLFLIVVGVTLVNVYKRDAFYICGYATSGECGQWLVQLKNIVETMKN